MKKINNILMLLSLLVFSACSDSYGELYRDNLPEIPVTFEGATTYGFNPYIQIPLNGDGVITFTMVIPSNSGRTIREIFSGNAGATSITRQSARTGTFVPQPVSGDGTRVTFQTSLQQFRDHSSGNNTLVQNFINSTTQNQLQIAFNFMLRLDDGHEINVIPIQVWINK